MKNKSPPLKTKDRDIKQHEGLVPSGKHVNKYFIGCGHFSFISILHLIHYWFTQTKDGLQGEERVDWHVA